MDEQQTRVEFIEGIFFGDKWREHLKHKQYRQQPIDLIYKKMDGIY